MRLAEVAFVSPIGNFGAALANPRARMSDHIYVLRGCSVPVIMRPVVDPAACWEVIGALWVPGAVSRAAAHVRVWSEGNIYPPPPGMIVSTLNLV